MLIFLTHRLRLIQPIDPNYDNLVVKMSGKI